MLTVTSLKKTSYQIVQTCAIASLIFVVSLYAYSLINNLSFLESLKNCTFSCAILLPVSFFLALIVHLSSRMKNFPSAITVPFANSFPISLPLIPNNESLNVSRKKMTDEEFFNLPWLHPPKENSLFQSYLLKMHGQQIVLAQMIAPQANSHTEKIGFDTACEDWSLNYWGGLTSNVALKVFDVCDNTYYSVKEAIQKKVVTLLLENSLPERFVITEIYHDKIIRLFCNKNQIARYPQISIEQINKKVLALEIKYPHFIPKVIFFTENPGLVVAIGRINKKHVCFVGSTHSEMILSSQFLYKYQTDNDLRENISIEDSFGIIHEFRVRRDEKNTMEIDGVQAIVFNRKAAIQQLDLDIHNTIFAMTKESPPGIFIHNNSQLSLVMSYLVASDSSG